MTTSAETLHAPYAQRHARELIADDRAGPAPYRPVAVRLRGVEKSFGATPVLRGIDLDIPSGQFVAIVGRSGCGKSTLLRLVAGLDKPSAGRIGIGSGRGSTAQSDPRRQRTRGRKRARGRQRASRTQSHRNRRASNTCG